MSAVSPPGFSAPRGDRAYAVLLVLINVGSQGVQALLSAVGRQVQADLLFPRQFSAPQVHVLYLVVFALCTPAWAFACGRFSRRSLLIAATVVWGAGCALATVSGDVVFFTLCMTLAAAGGAAVVPVTFSMAMDLVPKERRGYIFAWLSTAATLSFGLAIIVGGETVGSMSWRAPFLLFAALAAASTLALLIWKRYEPAHGAMEAELQEMFAGGKAYDYRVRPRDLRYLLTPRANLWLLLAGTFAMMPAGAVGWWFIMMLQRDHGFAPHTAERLMIALFVVQVPGQIIFGRFTDRLCARRADGKLVLLFVMSLTAAPLIAGAYLLGWDEASISSAGFVGFVALAFAAALAACPLPQLSYNAVGEINSPERRGVMFGLVNISRLVGRAIGIQVVAMTGAALFPAASGASSSWRISPALGLSALLLLPAALFVLPALRSFKRDSAALGSHLQSAADGEPAGKSLEETPAK